MPYKPSSSVMLPLPEEWGMASTRKQRLLYGVVLFVACLILIKSRWLQLESLWGDPSRWMFECARASRGEIPYRDFSFQYPPLGLWIVAAAYRLFGQTFLTTQIVVSLLGIGVIFASWRLATRLMSETLAFAVALVLVAITGSDTGTFCYLALRGYTIAAPVASLGIVIFLIAALDYARTGVMNGARWLQAALGGALCVLGKPEAALGAVAGIIGLALADRVCWFYRRPAGKWLSFYTAWFAVCLLPSLVIYAIYSRQTGVGPLIDGITGYGQAKISCPWWPDGLGLVDAVAGLGHGLFLLLLLSLPFARRILAGPKRGEYNILAVMALLGEAFRTWYVIHYANEGGIAKILLAKGFEPYAAFLTSGKWFGVALTVYLVYLMATAGKRRPEAEGSAAAIEGTAPPLSREALMLVAAMFAATAGSTRGLFSSHLNPLPVVSFAFIPVIAVLCAYSAVWFVRYLLPQETMAKTLNAAARIVAMVLIIFAAVRTLQSVTRINHFPYEVLNTRSGAIHIVTGGPSRAVYEYVMAHTKDSDGVMDVGYGGGVNFATQRHSPAYFTQYVAFKPSDAMMAADLSKIQADPPALVLSIKPFEGTIAYGIPVNVACPCPHLVFAPTGKGWDPDRRIPALDYIRAHWSVVQEFPANHVAGITEDSARLIFAPSKP